MKLAYYFRSNPAHTMTHRQTERHNDHITAALLAEVITRLGVTYLHRVRRMRIIKHQRFLHFLIVSLKLVEVRPVPCHLVLERVQRLEMVLKRAFLQSERSNLVQPRLDPLTNDVRLGSKLLTEPLVVLLANHLCLKDCISLRHQLAHLLPPLCQLLANVHTTYFSF